MKYRKLGNTGLIVSEVALGTMQFGGRMNMGNLGQEETTRIRDRKLIQFLCQQYACVVFDLMRDDEGVKEEIGFYNPAAWADEDGNPVINENRWKLWRRYSAGLPAMQFRNCRDAFYRTQMESAENNDPNRGRSNWRTTNSVGRKIASTAMIAMVHYMPFGWDFSMTNPHPEDWLGWQGQTLGKHPLRWDSQGTQLGVEDLPTANLTSLLAELRTDLIHFPHPGKVCRACVQHLLPNTRD